MEEADESHAALLSTFSRTSAHRSSCRTELRSNHGAHTTFTTSRGILTLQASHFLGWSRSALCGRPIYSSYLVQAQHLLIWHGVQTLLLPTAHARQRSRSGGSQRNTAATISNSTRQITDPKIDSSIPSNTKNSTLYHPKALTRPVKGDKRSVPSWYCHSFWSTVRWSIAINSVQTATVDTDATIMTNTHTR